MIHKNCGYSMIEMMITFSIGAIICLSTIPAYRELMISINRTTAFNQLEADVRLARSKARMQRARVILTIDPSTGYAFEIDYAPFNDPIAGDENLLNTPLPHDISLETADAVIFDSRGRLIDETGEVNQTTMTLKHMGSQYGMLTIYASGFLEKNQ